MDNRTYTKPEHMDEQDWLRHLQWIAEMDRQASEGYAQHLARVMQDADQSKALLQAHYRALHGDTGGKPGGHQPGSG